MKAQHKYRGETKIAVSCESPLRSSQDISISDNVQMSEASLVDDSDKAECHSYSVTVLLFLDHPEDPRRILNSGASTLYCQYCLDV
jgi:hypothetical protein